MKLRNLGLLTAVLCCATFSSVRAQAPTGAPSGATGVCNDGTYTMTASKRGACGGHKGVKTWLAASAAPAGKPAASVAPAAPSAPAAAPAKAPIIPASKAAPAQKTQAPGGGNGQVWVNTATKVYHCQGDKSYGTTKVGAYMSEADAKAKGARPALNKPCTR